MEERFKFVEWKELTPVQQTQALALMTKHIYCPDPDSLTVFKQGLNREGPLKTMGIFALDGENVFSAITAKILRYGKQNSLTIEYIASPYNKSKTDYYKQTKQVPSKRLYQLARKWGLSQGVKTFKGTPPIFPAMEKALKRRRERILARRKTPLGKRIKKK